MVQFLCMFMPSLLAVAILAGLQKRKLDCSYIVLAFGSFASVINLSVFFVLTYVFNNKHYLLNAGSFTNAFTVKYLFMSVVLAVVLPIVFEALRKNIQMSWS